MSHKIFYICNVIAENEEDYKTLLEYLGNYPVSISRNLPEELYFSIPTLIVGWNSIKDKFSSQNILDKQIQENLFWSFSKLEYEKDFTKGVEDFFTSSVKKWLPNNFKLYDSFLNKENIEDFFIDNINYDEKVFIYFSDGALYVFNDNNNFVINIKSLVNKDSNFRSTLTGILNTLDINAFSYHNIGNYIDLESLKEIKVLDSIRWVKYGVETTDEYFNIIPNFKIQKFIPFLMSRLNVIELDKNEKSFYSRMCKRDKITHWLSNREIAFLSTFENHKLDFKIRREYKLAKINYSNKRTITGRIVSRDVYNPQNLSKSNDERKDIISRFKDGHILAFDYISFETKIALYLSGDKQYIQQYSNKDLHYETAAVLYGNQNITQEQRNVFGKILNHSLLYGAGEDTLIKNLSERFDNPYEQLHKVRTLLKPIIDKANEIKEEYKEKGFLINPWGYIIKAENFHAGFSHYIQTYASEIVVEKLFEIKDFLKPYKTQLIFQVHDSLIFDLHPSEHFLIEQISKILSTYNDMVFGVKYSLGLNYKDL